MPNFIGVLNRAYSFAISGVGAHLAVVAPNNDSSRQIEIQRITYGYTVGTGVAPNAEAFGFGAVIVIQNHNLLPEGVTGYSSRGVLNLEGLSGDILHYDVIDTYGTRKLEFVNPLVIEPAMNICIIVPQAINATGGALASQVAQLSTQGRYVPRQAWVLGNRILR